MRFEMSSLVVENLNVTARDYDSQPLFLPALKPADIRIQCTPVLTDPGPLFQR